MPFTKVGPDTYTSPSGRKWTGAQVRKYYATNGFTEPDRPRAGKVKPARRTRAHT